MHLCYQGAGGIKYTQVALFSLLPYLKGYSMGTEDHCIAIRYLMQFVYKYGAAIAQTLHYKPVVYHIVTYIDGGAEQIQGTPNYLNRTVDAGTESAGGCE